MGELNTVRRNIGLIYLTTTLMWALLSPETVFAEKEIAGVVKAGSAGNRFAITVTNPSTKTSVGGLSLNVDGDVKWLENIRIAADTSGVLPPSASRNFTVTFDVNQNAEANAIETVMFRISADNVLFDYPNPKMTVKIEKSAEKKKTGSGSASPVLKLVKIEGPKPGHRTPGYSQHYNVFYESGAAGFNAASDDTNYYPDWISALRVTSAPLTITLGEPFEFTAEVKKRTIYKPGDKCFQESRVSDKTQHSAVMHIEPCNADVIGRDDLHAYCQSGDNTVTKGKTLDALVEKEGSVSLRILFKPEKTELSDSTFYPERKYHYRIEYKTDGKLKGHANMTKVYKELVIEFNQRIDEQGFLHPEETPSSLWDFKLSAYIDISVISLHYTVVHNSAACITSLPGYQWPAELTRPPRNEIAGRSDTPKDDKTGENKSGGLVGAGTGMAGALTGTGAGGGGAGFIDPNTLNPNENRASATIKEWLSLAEPPENAAGAKLHYDKWGRKIGTTAAGTIITSAAKPGYALSTPEETVWSMRDKLDSLNHCTMEAYVLAKLQNQALDCRGGSHKNIETGLAGKDAGARLEGISQALCDKAFSTYETLKTEVSNTNKTLGRMDKNLRKIDKLMASVDTRAGTVNSNLSLAEQDVHASQTEAEKAGTNQSRVLNYTSRCCSSAGQVTQTTNVAKLNTLIQDTRQENQQVQQYAENFKANLKTADSAKENAVNIRDTMLRLRDDRTSIVTQMAQVENDLNEVKEDIQRLKELSPIILQTALDSKNINGQAEEILNKTVLAYQKKKTDKTLTRTDKENKKSVARSAKTTSINDKKISQLDEKSKLKLNGLYSKFEETNKTHQEMKIRSEKLVSRPQVSDETFARFEKHAEDAQAAYNSIVGLEASVNAFEQKTAVCMESAETHFAGETSPQAQVAKTDCSRWPGTHPEWNAQKKIVECRCSKDWVWDGDNNRCVTKRDYAWARSNCDNAPGTHKVWNARKEIVECHCPNGQYWNGANNRCEAQAAAMDPAAAQQMIDGLINIYNQSPGMQKKGNLPTTGGTGNSSSGSGGKQRKQDDYTPYCEPPGKWNGECCMCPDGLCEMFGQGCR